MKTSLKWSGGVLLFLSLVLQLEGQARACTTNADCTVVGHRFCDPANVCVECVTSNDCPSSEPVCTAGNACVGCTVNSDCTRFNSGISAFCNFGTGACVDCSTNSNCLATAPVCSLVNICSSCSTDTDCSLFPTTPACQLASSAQPGTCGECAADDTTLCTGATPACNVAAGTCQLCTVMSAVNVANNVGCASDPDGHVCQGSGPAVFCGCSDDADCGGATSGRLCNSLTNTCTDGCSRASGRNDCPSGEFCTSDDATGAVTGVCTTACDFDQDCTTTAMPFCIGPTADGADAGADAGDASGANRCGACRGDADCTTASKRACDSSSNTCAECTGTNAAACAANANGSACLASDKCGCKSDSDCGGSTSGRICDAITSACALADGGVLILPVDASTGQPEAGLAEAGVAEAGAAEAGLADDEGDIEGGGCGCHVERQSDFTFGWLIGFGACCGAFVRRRTRSK